MALDFYAIANEIATSDPCLAKTTDAGATWTVCISQLWTHDFAYYSIDSDGTYVYCSGSYKQSFYADRSWIWRYDPATDTYDSINMHSAFGLSSAHHIIEIKAISPTKIYLICEVYNGGYTQMKMYDFNGNWSSPSGSDITYIADSASATFGRRYPYIYVSESEMYIGFDHSYDSQASQSCLWKWDGNLSVTRDSTLSDYDQCMACARSEYDGYDYLIAVHDPTNDARLLKGHYGNWTHIATLDEYDVPSKAGNGLYIDRTTGYVCWITHHSYPDGNSNSRPRLWWWDGSSQNWVWMDSQVDQYGTFTDLVGPSFSDLYNYYHDAFKIWDGSSWSDQSYSTINWIERLAYFDSYPYLDSSPTGKNNKYFTTVPLVWSIGD